MGLGPGGGSESSKTILSRFHLKGWAMQERVVMVMLRKKGFE